MIILWIKNLLIKISKGKIIESEMTERRKIPIAFSDMDFTDLKNSAYVNNFAIVRLQTGTRKVNVVSKVYLLMNYPKEREDLIIFDRKRNAGFYRGYLFRHAHNMLFIPIVYLFEKPPADYKISREPKEFKPTNLVQALREMYDNLDITTETQAGEIILRIRDNTINRNYWIAVIGKEVRTNVCIENIEKFRWYEIPALVRIAHKIGRLYIYSTEP